ncbi:MAG TPA: hypothetical protein VIK75_05800 [Calditerricola sp.]
MREFSVGLTARVSVSPGKDEDEAFEKACELLDALDADTRAMGPVAQCDHDARTAHARFNVEAEDIEAAIARAKEILADALEHVGLGRDMDLIEVEAEEFDESQLDELRAQLAALGEDEEDGQEEAAALEPAAGDPA